MTPLALIIKDENIYREDAANISLVFNSELPQDEETAFSLEQTFPSAEPKPVVPPPTPEPTPPAPEKKGLAWWVWLIIGLVIFLIIVGVVLYFMSRRKTDEEEEEDTYMTPDENKKFADDQ